MGCFKLSEEFARRTKPSGSRVFKALTDAFLGVGAGGNVEETLVGFRILHYSRGLAVDGEHNGALALLEMLHEVAGRAAESGQRLNVGGNVQRVRLPSSTF